MKKGDWIFDGCDSIGKAKSDPYEVCGRMQVDVTLYDRDGTCVGRRSPAMDGPTHFEPACDPTGWTVIEPPRFPFSRFCYLDEVLVRSNDENQRGA